MQFHRTYVDFSAVCGCFLFASGRYKRVATPKGEGSSTWPRPPRQGNFSSKLSCPCAAHTATCAATTSCSHPAFVSPWVSYDLSKKGSATTDRVLGEVWP